jgi:rod shape-determining protein MreD
MTVKKYTLVFLILIGVIMLQSAVISRLRIWGVTLDLVFVFIVCYSLIKDSMESIIVATFAGLIRDAFFPGVFGMNTLIFISFSYLIGFIQRRIYRDNIVIPAFFTFISTLAMGAIYFFFMFIMSYRLEFMEIFTSVILLQAVYHSVASIFMYKILLRLNSFGVLKDNWRF